MNTNDSDENTIYIVLINNEEQYSLWPKHKATPNGWRPAGKEGNRLECSQYVDEAWTDMRPLSLRQATNGSREPHS